MPNDCPRWCRRNTRILNALAAVCVCGIFLDGCIPPAPVANPAARPFPQHVAYAAGALAPNHVSQAQLDDDVRSAYGRWKTNYLASAGQDEDGNVLYRVKAAKAAGSATVSEGQGYGMLIVPLMADEEPEAQTLFNGLWRYAQAHRSQENPLLFDYYVNGDGSPDDNGDDSAFDGDADIAYGLLLADAQWGSDGDIDYRAEALAVLAAMLEAEIGPDSLLPLLGDWVDIGGAVANQWTVRSSDFMVGHFRAFARASGDSTWNQVAAACQSVVSSLQTNFAAGTGLLPDFIVPQSATDHSPQPAPPGFLEGPQDGGYYYNAGRDPWRLCTDWLINGNALSREQVNKMSKWIATETSGDPLLIRAGYRLDGDPLPDTNYFTSFYAAPFGVAAMSDPAHQAWLNDVYDSVSQKEEEYYEDSVTLLSMLVMSRNFWDPTL